MPWDQIIRGLQDVSAQLRLVAVKGEQGTTLLDDTYNASPSSTLAALNLLAELNGRKIAVLGNMLELGDMELQGHQVVGGHAAQVVQVLVAVGVKGRWIGQQALKSGLTDNQVRFVDSNAAAIDVLRKAMRPGDVILIKGSRGAKMEEIVSALTQSDDKATREQ
jgi:UDP-N-acetylmuramoyl-tripeptide--D-alanyl-D-alanine ligase